MSAEAERRTPPPRVGALASAADVRTEAARLYRSARRGDVPAADASKLSAVLGLILQAVAVSSHEDRITALEGGRRPVPFVARRPRVVA